jgi:hypothetical protein
MSSLTAHPHFSFASVPLDPIALRFPAAFANGDEYDARRFAETATPRAATRRRSDRFGGKILTLGKAALFEQFGIRQRFDGAFGGERRELKTELRSTYVDCFFFIGGRVRFTRRCVK